MNNKLLHKTSKAYLIYSVLILIISAPIFYYTIQKLYIREADDTLLLHKKEFLVFSASTLKQTDVSTWNRFNRNLKIDSEKITSKEIIFTSLQFDSLDNEMEPYRELNFPITIDGKSYTYSDKISLVETEDLVQNIAVAYLLIISVLLIGLFFITKKLSQNIWKPFYDTLDQIENFEIDKTKQPEFVTTSIEEFNRLNTSIQKLIEKNTIIYKNQKEFIENAAHELQTPLAVFQAKIDTLIQHTDITKEQSEILNSLNKNVARLNRLNKNLLLLSKIENNIYHTKETISINNLIERNIDFFTEQALAKNLTIKIELVEELLIQSNPILAEIFLSNLFLNAIKHNVQAGEIFIYSKKNQFIFSNTGNVKPLNTNTLFSRFSKLNPSEQGSGLGLSIIKKIADINNWKITYSYENNFHSFIISF